MKIQTLYGSRVPPKMKASSAKNGVKQKPVQKIASSATNGVKQKPVQKVASSAKNGEKQKPVQKTMPSVNEVSKKRRLTEEGDDTEKKVEVNATEAEDTKKILSSWRAMKIQKKREAARLELDQIKNTAGFSDNMDALRDFEMIISGNYLPSTSSEN